MIHDTKTSDPGATATPGVVWLLELNRHSSRGRFGIYELKIGDEKLTKLAMWRGLGYSAGMQIELLAPTNPDLYWPMAPVVALRVHPRLGSLCHSTGAGTGRGQTGRIGFGLR